MRVKKQRRHRKSIRFYAACYGFRQPFKILCDGTFVHHLLVHKITPADLALSNILGGGRVKLFTTKCVLAELRRLGSSHSDTLQASLKLMTASCEHETIKSADTCIREMIGESNPEHFFVATQDIDMRKRFKEIPGVPVIFGLRNALFLEQPSASQKQFIKSSEEDRSHMKISEFKILKKRIKEISGSEDADEKEGLNLNLSESHVEDHKDKPVVKTMQTLRKGTETNDRSQFKRRRAKGPNPLSCKKKKNPKKSEPILKKKENKDSENTESSQSKRKRKRKRKKSHKVES